MTPEEITHEALWLATRLAPDARCRRRTVAAVVFTLDGRYVAHGRNGGPLNEPGCPEGLCPRGLRTRAEVPSYLDGPTDYTSGPGQCVYPHAEDNAKTKALAAAERQPSVKINECFMAVSVPPCTDCENNVLATSDLAFVVWPGGRWGNPNA